MFEFKDFKSILSDTTELLERIKACPKDDIEELQMRIDSNVHALKIIASKIEDEDSKELFMKSIQSLSKTMDLTEIETIKHRKRDARDKTGAKNNDIIDSELLKNTLQLKKMAGEFSDSLKEDKKAIEKLSTKMGTNAEANTSNLRRLEKNVTFISSGTILSIVFMLFVVMYLIIRFF